MLDCKSLGEGLHVLQIVDNNRKWPSLLILCNEDGNNGVKIARSELMER